MSPRLVDALERTAVFGLYGWLLWRIISAETLEFGVFQLISEGMIVVFTLIRRPAVAISQRLSDWFLAFAGTSLPLLVTGGLGEGHLPIRIVTVVWLLGFVTQVTAKVWLGRNFGLVAARRELVAGGPYRYVRHPMYLGYLLTHLAVAGMNPSAINLALYAMCWLCQVPRLMAEERLLGEDEMYQKYREQVPWRLVPGGLVRGRGRCGRPGRMRAASPRIAVWPYALPRARCCLRTERSGGGGRLRPKSPHRAPYAEFGRTPAPTPPCRDRTLRRAAGRPSRPKSPQRPPAVHFGRTPTMAVSFRPRPRRRPLGHILSRHIRPLYHRRSPRACPFGVPRSR